MPKCRLFQSQGCGHYAWQKSTGSLDLLHLRFNDNRFPYRMLFLSETKRDQFDTRHAFGYLQTVAGSSESTRSNGDTPSGECKCGYNAKC
jgi:hypothetical protein